MFLKIPRYSQENTCVENIFSPATLLKRDSETVIFLRILQNLKKAILKNICKRLLLTVACRPLLLQAPLLISNTRLKLGKN